MIDILLINPPNSFSGANAVVSKGKGYVLYPPMGILYLASALQERGLEAEVIDILARGMSLTEVIDRIKSSQTTLVGISATSAQLPGSLQLATRIKEQFDSGVCVGIGGPHVSADTEFTERFDVFDFALIGEGEKTFADMVLSAKNGSHIKGVYYGENIDDLDSIPFPGRHFVNSGDYYIETYGNRFVTMHTARGCPFNCSFCSNPVGTRTTRMRSSQNVVDEIEYCIKEFNIDHVLFTDDTFTLNMGRTTEICEGILQRRLGLSWSCETRAGLVDRSLLELMHRAGCREISFGVECGNEEIREKVLHKRVSNADLILAFTECHRAGIEANAFCMLGMPGETRKHMLETLRFVSKIKPDIMGLHQTVLFPGSDLFNQAVDEGKITADIWDRYARGEITEQPIYIPDGFPKQSLDAMQKRIYLRYYYRPAYLANRFVKDITNPPKLKQDMLLGMSLLYSPRTKTGRP